MYEYDSGGSISEELGVLYTNDSSGESLTHHDKSLLEYDNGHSSDDGFFTT